MPDFAICDHMTNVIGPNAGCNLLFLHGWRLHASLILMHWITMKDTPLWAIVVLQGRVTIGYDKRNSRWGTTCRRKSILV